MNEYSRRLFFASVSTLLAGASGCTTTGSSPTPTRTEQGFAHTISTPTAAKIRQEDGNPAVRSSLFSPARGWDSEEWTVSSAKQRDALRFASSGDDEAREFVENSDLSTHTILIHQYGIKACLTRRLKTVRWRMDPDAPDGYAAISMDYVPSERDIECRADRPTNIEATIVRVPSDIEGIGEFSDGFTYDPERYDQSGD